MKWPDFSGLKVPQEANVVGDAIKQMTERGLKQAAADRDALNQRIAADAKRQRREDRAQTAVLNAELNRGN
ncbi:MAG TPA: hypothetical protein VNW47_09475 [Terriglobales bacterium]|jgi:hypothetical protein|nr:hypothetical protein [Terriglobales bacterium]